MRSARLAGALALALGVFSSSARAEDALDGVELTAKVDTAQPIEVTKLLTLWSDKLGVAIVPDQQMSGVTLRLPDQKLTWGAFKKHLDFLDVVLEEKDLAGARLFYAHLRRNLPCHSGPPFPIVAPEELAAQGEKIVTTLVKVQHGCGNDIFATVRGLLVRDVNRIGNILYVRGPETIIVVDFAANADYYVKIVKALDVPDPGSKTRVFDLANVAAEDAREALEPLLHEEPIVPNAPVRSTAPRIVAAPNTNQLLVRGGDAEIAQIAELVAKIDVAKDAPPPRFRASAAIPSRLWKLATACAFVAFLGQTILLRRLRRS